MWVFAIRSNNIIYYITCKQTTHSRLKNSTWETKILHTCDVIIISWRTNSLCVIRRMCQWMTSKTREIKWVYCYYYTVLLHWINNRSSDVSSYAVSTSQIEIVRTEEANKTFSAGRVPILEERENASACIVLICD